MEWNGKETEYEEPEHLSVIVNGVFISKHFETNRPMKEQVECIRALELREDDVILCAFPKAGTHWVWEVASMLLAGKTEYKKESKEFAMLEAVPIESTQQRASPRILNTHLPATMLPKEVKEKKVKVIHVYRNVKDVFVSLFFHFKQYPGRDDLTLEKLFSGSFFSPKNVRGNYFAYLKTMDDFMRENPDVPVFNMSFEEMKKDPLSVVSRLGEFLAVSPSHQLCQEIVSATSLTKLKEADQHKDHVHYVPTAQLYRKGEVGDWKNHLTVAQSERLDRAMQQLQGTRFSFCY